MIEQYLVHLHTGQWFTFSDPNNKSFDTLELTGYGEEQGYGLPTEEDFEAWQKEQEKLQKEREVITQRKKEYGSVGAQLENIIEAINGGTDPTQALKDEASRIQEIKERHPKG